MPSWSRLLEWSLVVGVIVVLGLVFARQVRVLQGQGELAAVRSTLGALRTALVIDHLQRQVSAGRSPVVDVQRNPFKLLERPPGNYRGVFEAAELAVAPAPAGSWVFDADCDCVGYTPLYAQWFVSPSGDAMAWYRLSGEPGPSQLTAKEAYVWQDEVLN